MRDNDSELFDPLGPLAIRWQYLPRLLPWLVRFVRAGSGAQVESQVRALAALLAPTFDDYLPLLQSAGVADSLISEGALTVYHEREAYLRDALEWDTKRACGIPTPRPTPVGPRSSRSINAEYTRSEGSP